jgi:hypothetical protein
LQGKKISLIIIKIKILDLRGKKPKIDGIVKKKPYKIKQIVIKRIRTKS